MIPLHVLEIDRLVTFRRERRADVRLAREEVLLELVERGVDHGLHGLVEDERERRDNAESWGRNSDQCLLDCGTRVLRPTDDCRTPCLDLDVLDIGASDVFSRVP